VGRSLKRIDVNGRNLTESRRLAWTFFAYAPVALKGTAGRAET
jgi:hypothetical protein